MESLLFLIVFLLSGNLAQIKDSESLIYYFDPNHNINYYCQFATYEVIRKSSNFQILCFDRNEKMQHILPNGDITFPYLSYGSRYGIVLSCPQIADANYRCTRYVYTQCNFTCHASDVMQQATCQLEGPWDNVTARWSVTDPCRTDKNGHRESLARKDEHHGNKERALSHAYAEQAHIGDNSTLPSNATVVIPDMPVAATVIVSHRVDPVKVAVPVLCVFAVIALFALFTHFRKHKKNPLPCCRPTVNGTAQDSKDKFSKVNIIYTDIRQIPNDDPDVTTSAIDFRQIPNDDPDVTSNAIDNMQSCNHNRTPLAGSFHPGPPIQEGFADFDRAIKTEIDNFDTLSSVSSTWDRKKVLLDEDLKNVARQPQPDQCSETAVLFRNQTTSYRRKLRAVLEVIEGRPRNQALVGYMEEHWKDFHYQTQYEIKLIEKTYANTEEEKASDRFLQDLAAHGVKLGYILDYFSKHRNRDAISVILEVHVGCPYCKRYQDKC